MPLKHQNIHRSDKSLTCTTSQGTRLRLHLCSTCIHTPEQALTCTTSQPYTKLVCVWSLCLRDTELLLQKLSRFILTPYQDNIHPSRTNLSRSVYRKAVIHPASVNPAASRGLQFSSGLSKKRQQGVCPLYIRSKPPRSVTSINFIRSRQLSSTGYNEIRSRNKRCVDVQRRVSVRAHFLYRVTDLRFALINEPGISLWSELLHAEIALARGHG